MSKQIFIKLIVFSWNLKHKEQPFILIDEEGNIPTISVKEEEFIDIAAKNFFKLLLGYEARILQYDTGWVDLKFCYNHQREFKPDSVYMVYSAIIPEVFDVENYNWKKINDIFNIEEKSLILKGMQKL